MGLQSTASAGSNKPVNGVAIRSSSTSSTAPGIYQVPEGRYFVGSIYAPNQSYGFNIHDGAGNSAKFFDGGNENQTQSNFALQNIVLYAGMYVTNTYSSQNTSIAGVEYEL